MTSAWRNLRPFSAAETAEVKEAVRRQDRRERMGAAALAAALVPLLVLAVAGRGFGWRSLATDQLGLAYGATLSFLSAWLLLPSVRRDGWRTRTLVRKGLGTALVLGVGCLALLALSVRGII